MVLLFPEVIVDSWTHVSTLSWRVRDVRRNRCAHVFTENITVTL